MAYGTGASPVSYRHNFLVFLYIYFDAIWLVKFNRLFGEFVLLSFMIHV